MSTIEILEELENQKSELAKNLVNKGVFADGNLEGFNTLVPKVLNIYGGQLPLPPDDNPYKELISFISAKDYIKVTAESYMNLTFDFDVDNISFFIIYNISHGILYQTNGLNLSGQTGIIFSSYKLYTDEVLRGYTISYSYQGTAITGVSTTSSMPYTDDIIIDNRSITIVPKYNGNNHYFPFTYGDDYIIAVI